MKVTSRAAVASCIATLVYLGLAVLGSGGFEAFFSHPQLTVVVVATLAMAVAALFTEGNLSSGERENRDNEGSRRLERDPGDGGGPGRVLRRGGGAFRQDNRFGEPSVRVSERLRYGPGGEVCRIIRVRRIDPVTGDVLVQRRRDCD